MTGNKNDCVTTKGRRIVSGGRRYTMASGEDIMKSKMLNNIKTKLGKGASREVLDSRACPLNQSPKRAIPMEVDVRTPTKKKKRERCQSNRIESGQRLLTELGGKKSDEGDRTSNFNFISSL